MNENKKMAPVIKTIIATILLLLSGFLIGVGGLVNWIPGGKDFGVRACAKIYLAGFTGNFTSKLSFLVLAIILVSFVLLIAEIIKLILSKQYKSIFPAIAIMLGVCFLPYLAILAYRSMANNAVTKGALWVILVSLFFDLFGLIVMYSAIKGFEESAKPAIAPQVIKEEPLSEDQIRVIVREEIENYEATKEKEEIKVLTEEDVTKISKKIVEKAINEHVSSKHVEENDVAEESDETEEEPLVEPSTEVSTENDPFASLRNKRRANFETRLKNSEFDLRHKYYDLRDYIKSYGLNNRISIPGDTFSAHRKRYVFITVNGKHLKVYFAANPDDYKDTPIPVERVTTKRFEDLPLQFKVRSDLSFRRALKLVDDMLTKEGYVREDKPIKNTQSQDEN